VSAACGLGSAWVSAAAVPACLLLQLYWCPLQSKQLSWDLSAVMGPLVLPGREGWLLGPEEEHRNALQMLLPHG